MGQFGHWLAQIYHFSTLKHGRELSMEDLLDMLADAYEEKEASGGGGKK
jgi:hypothetical protein